MFEKLTPAFRKVLSNTGWLMVDRAVRMGFGVFVGVWIARYLGPSRFGALNFAISFVALFGTLATLGVDNIVVKEIVLNASDAPEILGSAFAVKIVGCIFTPLLAIATVRLIQPHDPAVLLLVSLLSLGLSFQVFDTIDSYFQSRVQSKLTVWAKNSAFLVITGFRIWLIHVEAPVWAFAAAQTAELALGALGLVIIHRWTGGRLSLWRVRRRRAIDLLKQSWPVILSSMAIMIYMRIDMVMLKLMRGETAVGVYAAATRVSEVWYFIPMAIVSSVSPAIIRAKHNQALYFSRIRKLFSVMTLIALGIGSGIALGSHWIIHILYSDTYIAAAPVLAVHVWASIFVFMGVAQGPWDMAEDLLKVSFYRTLAGAVVNVLLNLVLIPKYAAMGAAFATVISYAIAGIFANAFYGRTRPIFFLQLQSFLPTSLWTRQADPESSDKLNG